MAIAPPPDRTVLASRIQGFGNVNPPPLEEETGATVAKKALGRLGDIVGEEVMLTVEDFREKGAVGAVKDAVADAGDILIDGVSGLVGWIRGDPPREDDGAEKAEAATQALTNGPAGAAYGVSQASPTGGINAVWVMPEDADPMALASLTSAGGLVGQTQDPRVPKNIQPYQPPSASRSAVPPNLAHGGPLTIPGGPTIAPYQPAPSGPSGLGSPSDVRAGYSAGNCTSSVAGASGIPQGHWGPSGYCPSSGSTAASNYAATGSRALVERVAKGEVMADMATAKRLVSQCMALNTTAKQFSEMICERVRRLYLGLDGSDPADADAALVHLLGLTDAIAEMSSDFAQEAVKEVKEGVSEELLSLLSNAKHKDIAEPLLRKLGLLGKAHDLPDLLDNGNCDAAISLPVPAQARKTASAETADLLNGIDSPAVEADLLNDIASPGIEEDLLSYAASPVIEADLLGHCQSAAEAANSIASLDPLRMVGTEPSTGTSATGHNLLAGLTIDVSPAMPGAASSLESLRIECGSSASSAAIVAAPQLADESAVGVASNAQLDALAAEASQKQDREAAFNFVGDELVKAQDGRG